MDKIKLAIIEDDEALRDMLQMYLSGDQELFDSVLAFGSVEKALESEQSLDGHIVLLDINLPGMTGIQGIPLLKQKYSELNIVMLSVLQDSENIFAAICNGASGYLEKETPVTKIKDALKQVQAGGSSITPAIARKIFDHFQPEKKLHEDLTNREQEVVQGIIDGLSYKLIADRLDVSINTVRKYIRKIYSKLHINSKGELFSKFHR